VPRQSLRRASGLILSALFLLSIASTLAKPQEADDIDTLKRQVQQLYKAEKYTEALALQYRVAAAIEKAEIASAGRPGTKTGSALVSVAWYALLAHDFKTALAASSRAHALAPTNLHAEINRAHVLLFLGHLPEAQAIYFAYKGKPISLTSNEMWEDVIAGDVESLRKAGLKSLALVQINTKLGGKSSASHADLTELDERIQELDRTGKYKEAEAAAEKFVALVREQYGEGHPKFATATSWLGFILRKQGRYAEAEPLMRRARAIDEKALGPDHADVGRDLTNLALLYQDQGRYAEAEPLMKRARAIDEKALGLEHPNVAVDLNNLALLYQDQGRYAEAEPLMKRALAIDEKALGLEHPDVGRDLNNLATLYQDQGRYAEAEPLMKRALAIDEKALGLEHPDVGGDLNNLGELYQDQGRYAEAEPLQQRALAIDEKALGLDHPRVGIDLNNLAQLYQSEGRYAEAEPLMKRALEIQEKALGLDHPRVGIDLNNLAELYKDQGRYAEAEPLLKRARAIDEKAFGLDHPTVGGDLNNLAGLYFAQSDWGRAADLWRDSTDVIIRRASPGSRGHTRSRCCRRCPRSRHYVSSPRRATPASHTLASAIRFLKANRGNSRTTQRPPSSRVKSDAIRR
jgi:tetratricopeptide (TPR) repeat protein